MRPSQAAAVSLHPPCLVEEDKNMVTIGYKFSSFVDGRPAEIAADEKLVRDATAESARMLMKKDKDDKIELKPLSEAQVAELEDARKVYAALKEMGFRADVGGGHVILFNAEAEVDKRIESFKKDVPFALTENGVKPMVSVLAAGLSIASRGRAPAYNGGIVDGFKMPESVLDKELAEVGGVPRKVNGTDSVEYVLARRVYEKIDPRSVTAETKIQALAKKARLALLAAMQHEELRLLKSVVARVEGRQGMLQANADKDELFALQGGSRNSSFFSRIGEKIGDGAARGWMNSSAAKKPGKKNGFREIVRQTADEMVPAAAE